MQSGARVLDMKIAEIGKKSGKDVIGLETISTQIEALASVPEQQQLDMLRSSLRFADRTNDMMETLVQLYLKRRISAALPFQIALAQESGVGGEAFAGFQQKLLFDRNANMRKVAEPLLDQGGIFIASGPCTCPATRASSSCSASPATRSPPSSSSFRLAGDGLDDRPQGRKVLFGDVPDDVDIDALILVSQLVPDRDDVSPRDAWVFSPKLLRNMPCGLGYDLDCPLDGEPKYVVRRERLEGLIFDGNFNDADARKDVFKTRAQRTLRHQSTLIECCSISRLSAGWSPVRVETSTVWPSAFRKRNSISVSSMNVKRLIGSRSMKRSTSDVGVAASRAYDP